MASITKCIKSALLVPPASPGSFGDEAIVIGSINYLLDHGINYLGVVSHIKMEREKHPVLPIEFIDCSGYFEEKDDTDVTAFEEAVERYESCLFFGVDMLDGYYSLQTSLRRLRLVQIAAKKKSTVSIIGFSFNADPKQEIVYAFKEFGNRVEYFIRDRISYERFKEATGLIPKLTADPAFLFAPYREGPLYREIRRFRRWNRRKGRKLIGINPNYMPSLKSEDISTKDFIDFHAGLVARIIKELKSSVVLFPHDIRGLNSDLSLCRKIYALIPAELQEWVVTAVPERGAAEIKGIAGLLDCSVCQRMHTAIACLGEGTPCLCVNYQNKFEGLLDHFGIENCSMERKDAYEKDVMFRRLKDVLARENELHLQIKSKLPEVITLAEKNFEGVVKL